MDELDRIRRWVEDARAIHYPGFSRGACIVLATGCFDLLHVGHVDLLRRAAAEGAAFAQALAAQREALPPLVRLVVGINADAGVRRLKGAGRPIVPAEQRREHLLALRYVSAVAIFDEETPEALIRAVRPDLYVKGGDYQAEALPEYAVLQELGAVARILPRRIDVSTTGLLARAREVAGG